MLSIQVHPSKEAAAIGFDEEEANNILILHQTEIIKIKTISPK